MDDLGLCRFTWDGQEVRVVRGGTGRERVKESLRQDSSVLFININGEFSVWPKSTKMGAKLIKHDVLIDFYLDLLRTLADENSRKNRGKRLVYLRGKSKITYRKVNFSAGTVPAAPTLLAERC